MKKDLIKTYPFEHFKKQMPKEIQDLITDNSLTGADEFESEADALLFGCRWQKTQTQL